MNSKAVISSVGPADEAQSCPRCGSTSRIERGLCINCLLYRGLGEETYDNETLDQILDEIEVQDADWRLGNYQILEEIGRGGMGVIYRARQRHSRRIVALKRILAHHADSHDTLVRFRREAEAAASLDHPNILPIYEVSESDDGFPFFSMKFAAGGSLLEHQIALRGESRPSVALMAKVSRAVEYAHSRSILHRDLKPGNVLLDGRGEPMVSDFGLAKWLDNSSDLTRTLTVFGTPGYIAPEQAHGPASSLKPTADVYSLGAMLFDLIAGRPPFLGEHALSVIEQAKERSAPKLRSIIPKTDRDLETICARCLEREPKLRYQSAGGLAEDLERWLDGRPVIARPVSPPVRIWRWAKRNPKLAASVGGCVLGGLIALAFVTFTFLPDTSPFRTAIAIPEKSIAVLPFQNLSTEKQDAFFADGVQDEILNDLAKVADLKVISRTSVMQFTTITKRNLREIAKQLGVAHVLEGTVQRASGRVRVSAQLIDALTDTHVWAEHYDRDLADVFTVESEIAEKVVSQLKSKLSSDEKSAIEEQPTADLAAYDLYTEAKLAVATSDSNERENLLTAESLLKLAVRRDPQFYLAFYQLARTEDRIYIIGIDHTPERLALADAAIQTLTRLRPNSGEAHLALAAHVYSAYLDYDRARSELSLATTTLPNEKLVFELTGYIDRRQARWEDCISNLKRALTLDPRNAHILVQLATAYERLRRFDEMCRALDRAHELFPQDPGIRVQRATASLESDADTNALHATIKSIIDESPATAPLIAHSWLDLALCERDPQGTKQALAAMKEDGCRKEGIPFPPAWCEGVAARARGDAGTAKAAFSKGRAEIQRIVGEQPNYAEALGALGLFDAALGRKQEAIREGRRAIELLPVAKDAINGELLVEYLAVIYGWSGDREHALEQLAIATRIPGDLNYGNLRLNPLWDPLRADPRFAKIVAAYAPK